MTEPQAQQFANIYGSRRKGPQMILVAALIGFVFVGGVQRFLIGQIGIGLLYFFTGGLCFIGTLVDVLNHKKLAFEYNSKEARYVQAIVMRQAGNAGPPYYS
jgi:TM2 domain-containing membrane protein YozV